MITKLIKKILNNYAYDVFVNRNYDRIDSSIQTVSNTKNIDKTQYEQNGILRFRSIFDQANINEWRDRLNDELKTDEFLIKNKTGKYWISSVDKISFGEDIVSNTKLLNVLKILLGDTPKFIGHDSFSINFSSPGIHDDQNSYRELYSESELDDVSEVRVLFNLNKESTEPQRFGFISTSHLRKNHNFSLKKAKSNLIWIEVSYGDVIFFNPRILHSADRLRGEKHMCVLTYDKQNSRLEKVYNHTSLIRNQGTKPNSLLWKKLSNYNLTPDFLK